MLRTILAACALLCAFTINADAKPRPWQSCIPTSDVMRPCAYQANFLAGVRSIRVKMKREKRAAHVEPRQRVGAASLQLYQGKPSGLIIDTSPARGNGLVVAPARVSAYGAPSPSFAHTIAKPLRYIAGRLICAINVNAALAERGIRGTGSARAHSFDRWRVRLAQPIPGAVAVTDRPGRGKGHVAIVSRVEGSRVFVWNPSPRGRGWQEMEYTNRRARYRVAG